MKNFAIILIILAGIGGFVFLNKKSNVDSNMADEMLGASGEINTSLDGARDFDIGKSTANWTGSKKIITDWVDRGELNIKSGFATFDKGILTGGEIVFDMTSIKAKTTGKGDGEDRLSEHLKSEDFFDVANFPEAKFLVKSSAKESDGTYILTGDLTIKDITNSISFPVNLLSEGDLGMIEGSVSIDRTLWNVKFGSDKFFQDLGDNVINDEFNLDFTVITK